MSAPTGLTLHGLVASNHPRCRDAPTTSTTYADGSTGKRFTSYVCDACGLPCAARIKADWPGDDYDYLNNEKEVM